MSLFKVFRLVLGAALAVLCGWLVYGGVMGIQNALGGLTESEIAPAIVRIAMAMAVAMSFIYAFCMASPIRKAMENIFSIPELIRKLAFTLALLCIYRIGFHVPLPGLDQEQLAQTMKSQESGPYGQALQYFNMFTGGNLQQSTLFGLGIMPYISASIILQLLGTVWPALEKLKKEGPAGYRKIQEYTRYLTVPLCLMQAIIWMGYLRGSDQGGSLIYQYNSQIQVTMVYLMGVIGLTTGTLFLMWLGEQIDEYGIGNGISLLIMAGIMSRLPWAIYDLSKIFDPTLYSGQTEKVGILQVVLLVGMFVLVVAGAILIMQGQRRIPIQQAKQMRGRRVYGGQRQYLPLRVNHGGVMPLIFASSLMIFPGALFGQLSKMATPGTGWANWLNMMHGLFSRNSYVYNLLYVGLIFFFSFFWTTVQFRPKEMSDQLRDYGTFIPGLRPGRRTAEYLERVMERITYCGAAFLALIAVIPTVVSEKLGVPFRISAFLGGTGLLIVVSVALDLVQRIEANLVMRNYGGFLGGGRSVKGPYG